MNVKKGKEHKKRSFKKKIKKNKENKKEWYKKKKKFAFDYQIP